MTTFKLKSGADEYTLDFSGAATKGGVAAGSWSSNAANQIEITKAGAAKVTIDVSWAFDADNHLVLSSGGTPVMDFNAQAGIRPLIRTVNSALFVKPDKSGTFEFTLHPTWNLNEAHDMDVTIGATKSTIDGFVFDNQGRFRYHYFDKKNLLAETVLGFKGEWVNEPSGNAPGVVHFKYDLETAGQQGEFQLPKVVVVDKSLNQLAYVYDKAGHTMKVQLVGTFEFKDLELSYAIERSQDSDGKSTTLRFGAILNTKNASGTLDFALTKKTGAATSTTLSIGGTFTSQFKGGQLSLGFRFSQQRMAGVISNTLFFEGKLIHKNGTFSWTMEMNGTVMTIGISLQQIQIGEARLQGGLNVTLDNGKVVGVRALLGVSF